MAAPFFGSLTDAIAATSALPLHLTTAANPTIRHICTDSRRIQPGDLFVALRGERFDGHEFVPQVIQQGAIAAVVSQNGWQPPLPLLQVPDTLRALQQLAAWWRDRFTGPVIGITGSAGKTTTKEIVAAMLSRHGTPDRVHKSQANHNNDIGVSQTLLSLDPRHHDFAVVEMAMRGPGQIARLTEVARPQIGVITNIGTAHIGLLGSKAAIARAKCELLAAMHPDGIAILNAEDDLLLATAATLWKGRTLTYGITRGDIRGQWQEGSLTVCSTTWELPLPGRHNALNFLAGLAVQRALDLDWRATAGAPLDLDLPSGRAEVLPLPGNVVVLDETYNCSPEAAIAALHLLAQTPAKRRWAVLGTMKELGDFSLELHRCVGQTVAELGIDGLVVLTDGESDAILAGAEARVSPCWGIGDRDVLLSQLLQAVAPGDCVLFKASRSVGMDRLAAAFQEQWRSRYIEG
jgi:UDP-N-acetylmuramoyl-tripeptide--D-alanyl-D-alanine ligase